MLLLKARRELFREIEERDSGYHFNLAFISPLGTEPAEELPDDRELMSISEALDELAKADPSLANIVDLRFFCGFSFAEIAAMEGVAERTVQQNGGSRHRESRGFSIRAGFNKR